MGAAEASSHIIQCRKMSSGVGDGCLVGSIYAVPHRVFPCTWPRALASGEPKGELASRLERGTCDVVTASDGGTRHTRSVSESRHARTSRAARGRWV